MLLVKGIKDVERIFINLEDYENATEIDITSSSWSNEDTQSLSLRQHKEPPLMARANGLPTS